MDAVRRTSVSGIAVYQACGIREYHHSVENRSASIFLVSNSSEFASVLVSRHNAATATRASSRFGGLGK